MIPNQLSILMLRFELAMIIKTVDVLIENLKSGGFSADETAFWFRRIEAYQAVAQSNAAIIKLSDDLDAALLDAALAAKLNGGSNTNLIAH